MSLAEQLLFLQKGTFVEMKSIVSYPERGEGGRNSYRGNCSPKLILDLYDQFQFSEISDYMCGSGTTEDVAKQLGIPAHCYDLNRGFDLMTMDISERNEFIFWHPPYADMIQYAGSQYSAEEIVAKYGIDPMKSDLSQIKDWDEFVRAMNWCMLKQYASLEKGGRIAVLMGDMKRKGKLYSMLVDIAKPGTLENIVIKAQHNCWSDSQTYSGKFIPIVHEYLMICRKDAELLVPVALTYRRTVDVRDMVSATWKDVVYEAMKAIGGKCSLDELYSSIDGHKRTKQNGNWQAKIRQTLQMYPSLFSHVERGVWSLRAA